MDWLTIIFLSTGFLFGIFIGWLGTSIARYKKAPKAGNILINLHRDTDQVIRIEGTRRMSKWAHYKQLTFDVIVETDSPYLSDRNTKIIDIT